MSAPIKVAQITLSMGQGGIENLLVSMAGYQQKKNISTYLYCLDSGGELLETIKSAGAIVRVFHRKPGTDWKLIRLLAKAYKEDGIDIVHTHNQAAHFYGCLAKLLTSKPIIVNTEHSRHYIEGHWRRSLEKKILSYLTKKMVTVSDELLYASIEKDRIAPAKLATISNGIDLNKFNGSGSTEISKLKEKMGYRSNDQIICIVARLNPIKNHKLLLEAFTQIYKTKRNIHLLIIGDGELRSELEAYAVRLSVDDKVKFLGDRSDIPELLKMSNVMVLCSYREGLPLVLLEGMAAGIPIVVTPGANRSGIIKDLETGFVCEETAVQLAKKITIVLESHKVQQVINNARKCVSEDYSIAQTAEQYKMIYAQALGQTNV